MRKVITWLKTSNRYLHIIAGLLIGLGANDFHCACYTGVVAAGAVELKDKLSGGKWDWIDFLLTTAGAVVGHLIRWAVL